MWFDTRIRDDVTFPMYESLHPWPLNKIIARRIRANQTDLMLSRKAALNRDEVYTLPLDTCTRICSDVQCKILEDAKKTLSALSTQLGSQLYFFGSK